MLNQTVQGSIIQRRMIDKKLYKVFGALWDINDLRRDYDSAFPLCDNCRIALKGETIDFSKIESTYVCPKCGKKFEFLLACCDLVSTKRTLISPQPFVAWQTERRRGL